jgi:hypothetical protein
MNGGITLMARFGHGALSDLGPLSEADRKSNFGSAKSVVDLERTFGRLD